MPTSSSSRKKRLRRELLPAQCRMCSSLGNSLCRVPLRTAGHSIDLSPRLKQDQDDADDFYPAVLAAGRYAGTQVALPEAWSPHLMYVNRGLFQQAQLPLPDYTWTYDRWLEAAARLTQAEADPPVWGALYSTWFPSLLHTLWAWGGSLVSADGQRCALDSPPAVAALQWIADLWLTHRVSPSPTDLMGAPDAWRASSRCSRPVGSD